MKFVFEGNPIAKARHRTFRRKGKTMSYDPQQADKVETIWEAKRQMLENAFKAFKDEPLEFRATFHMPIPKSWPKKRVKNVLEENPCHTSKADLDNILKYYSDILNEVAYDDDSRISKIWCEKIYSVNPKVEIEINSIGGNVINEHAITVPREITMEQLDYMIKKAHKIGKQGRQLSRVFSEEDDEGRHIYFEVGCLKERVSAVTR